MCSQIDLDLPPGSRGTDKCLPEHQDGIRPRRVAASGGDEETFFPHESSPDDDRADLSDRTERGQGYQEVIENAVKLEINRRMKEQSRKCNAQRKEMEKQLEQRDGEIKTLREELASKEATLKLTVSERDKQVEEKRNQAATMRKLKEQLKVIEEQFQGLQRKHRSAINKLENSKAFAASVLERERADNRDKDAKLSERELALTVSRETCSQNRLEIQQLKDELSVVKASNTQLTMTTEDLQCRNETLQRELETKMAALGGIMSLSLELTNKVKDVKEQQTNDDEESDDRIEDSGIYCVEEDDIDSLPPLTMTALADYVEDITPKWDLVGHSLSVGTSVIQSLRDQPYSPQSKCTQVLEKWLEEDPEVSWIKLFDVLKRQRLNSLMSRMFQRLKPKPQ